MAARDETLAKTISNSIKKSGIFKSISKGIKSLMPKGLSGKKTTALLGSIDEKVGKIESISKDSYKLFETSFSDMIDSINTGLKPLGNFTGNGGNSSTANDVNEAEEDKKRREKNKGDKQNKTLVNSITTLGNKLGNIFKNGLSKLGSTAKNTADALGRGDFKSIGLHGLIGGLLGSVAGYNGAKGVVDEEENNILAHQGRVERLKTDTKGDNQISITHTMDAMRDGGADEGMIEDADKARVDAGYGRNFSDEKRIDDWALEHGFKLETLGDEEVYRGDKSPLTEKYGKEIGHGVLTRNEIRNIMIDEARQKYKDGENVTVNANKTTITNNTKNTKNSPSSVKTTKLTKKDINTTKTSKNSLTTNATANTVENTNLTSSDINTTKTNTNSVTNGDSTVRNNASNATSVNASDVSVNNSKSSGDISSSVSTVNNTNGVSTINVPNGTTMTKNAMDIERNATKQNINIVNDNSANVSNQSTSAFTSGLSAKSKDFSTKYFSGKIGGAD